MLEQPAPAVSASLARPAASWWRLPLGWLSPSGSHGRLAVLMFHRVHSQRDPFFPTEMTATTFRERLEWIGEWFNVLALGDAIGALASGTLPARAAAITFDDGYADNAVVALPILRELGLPATFFIATGFLDGGRMWNDTIIEAVRRANVPVLDLASRGLGRHELTDVAMRRTAIDALLRTLKHRRPDERQAQADHVAEAAGVVLPRDLMMTSADVKRIAATGMDIGAHTVHHPILATLEDAEARKEIAESREVLVGLLHQPITLFAYPNGKPGRDYRARDVRLAQELGFAAAFSTAWGAARCGDSLYELPRFTPWDATPGRWGLRFARNYLASIERAA